MLVPLPRLYTLALLYLLYLSTTNASSSSSPNPRSRDPRLPADFDCPARQLALQFASTLLPAEGLPAVRDALRLQDCPRTPNPPAPRRPTPRFDVPHAAIELYVAVNGSDQASGAHPSTPLRTLRTALDRVRLARDVMGSKTSVGRATIHVCGGTHELEQTLRLGPADSNITLLGNSSCGVVGAKAVLSGGVAMELSFVPLEPGGEGANPDSDVWAAEIPAAAAAALPEHLTTLLLAATNKGEGERRLPWAREPNGDVERDLQPDGYALATGSSSSTSWPDDTGSIWESSTTPARNDTFYPVFGLDRDPRESSGWQALHVGGSARRFADGRSFWNGSVPLGLVFNRTGGVTPDGYLVKGFNISHWPKQNATAGAVAHVFHPDFWGNWQFALGGAALNTTASSLAFPAGSGGWQEGHGGGIRTNQPFFVEGVRAALDSPGEWWLDSDLNDNMKKTMLIVPNASWWDDDEDEDDASTRSSPASPLRLRVVAPRLQRLVELVGASASQSHYVRGVRFVELGLAHTAPTYLEPYEVPSPGDWSIHRGGALFMEGAEDAEVLGCTFRRCGGNALFLSGHVWNTRVESNEFVSTGDSAVATVGSFKGSDGASTELYPADTKLLYNHFHEVGIHGKQTSALFSALSCRTHFQGNVAYNGPRAAVNVNDGYCGGHNITGNLLFNWVRETQDHGPINTWNRACYVQRAARGEKNGDENENENENTKTNTLTPAWTTIEHNFIMNGPSGNRDLGNLFPTIDNDDGSAFYLARRNVLVYGGVKNFLGHDKVWEGNLIAFPDRWAGDGCLTAWGGEHNVYVNNTCVLGTATNSQGEHTDPVGLDLYPFSGRGYGFVCHLDWENATARRYTASAAANRYFTPRGDWVFACPDNSTKGVAPLNHTLRELQAAGWEKGSTVQPRKAFAAADMIAMARQLLRLDRIE